MTASALRIVLLGTLLAAGSCEGDAFGVEQVHPDGRCAVVSETDGTSTPVVVGESLQYRFFVYDPFYGEDPPKHRVGVESLRSSDAAVIRVEGPEADADGLDTVHVVGVAVGEASVEVTSVDGETLSLDFTVVESEDALRYDEMCATDD